MLSQGFCSPDCSLVCACHLQVLVESNNQAESSIEPLPLTQSGKCLQHFSRVLLPACDTSHKHPIPLEVVGSLWLLHIIQHCFSLQVLATCVGCNCQCHKIVMTNLRVGNLRHSLPATDECVCGHIPAGLFSVHEAKLCDKCQVVWVLHERILDTLQLVGDARLQVLSERGLRRKPLQLLQIIDVKVSFGNGDQAAPITEASGCPIFIANLAH
mmetsp:Transcript_54238/g.100246  ORF Transcript_54238/g.100246 Transcript_54238/m.100246 type:complete len:213 (+) Transcript_54238:279-917(+)